MFRATVVVCRQPLNDHITWNAWHPEDIVEPSKLQKKKALEKKLKSEIQNSWWCWKQKLLIDIPEWCEGKTLVIELIPCLQDCQCYPCNLSVQSSGCVYFLEKKKLLCCNEHFCFYFVATEIQATSTQPAKRSVILYDFTRQSVEVWKTHCHCSVHVQPLLVPGLGVTGGQPELGSWGENNATLWMIRQSHCQPHVWNI